MAPLMLFMLARPQYSFPNACAACGKRVEAVNYWRGSAVFGRFFASPEGWQALKEGRVGSFGRGRVGVRVMPNGYVGIWGEMGAVGNVERGTGQSYTRAGFVFWTSEHIGFSIGAFMGKGWRNRQAFSSAGTALGFYATSKPFSVRFGYVLDTEGRTPFPIEVGVRAQKGMFSLSGNAVLENPAFDGKLDEGFGEVELKAELFRLKALALGIEGGAMVGWQGRDVDVYPTAGVSLLLRLGEEGKKRLWRISVGPTFAVVKDTLGNVKGLGPDKGVGVFIARMW